MLLGLQLVLITLSSMRYGTVERCARAVRDGVSNDEGQVIWLFKVAGERRLIGVIDGGLEGAYNKLAENCREVDDIQADPLRTYESFSRDVLKIKTNLTDPSPHFLFPNQPIYWLTMEVVFPDRDIRHVMDSFKRDAIRFLTVRQEGLMAADLFMVLGRLKMHVFVAGPVEGLDNGYWARPMTLEMGGNVHTTFKSIVSPAW